MNKYLKIKVIWSFGGDVGLPGPLPPPALLPTPPHPLALGSSEKYSLLLLSKTVTFTELCCISDCLNIFIMFSLKTFEQFGCQVKKKKKINFILSETKNKGVHA